MNWRDVSSLPALRAFEAVARQGSLSAAARELNVTHAAIAQHLRTVEDHLQTSLVTRAGKGMALTEQGAQLAAALNGGFQQIVDGVEAVNAAANDRPIALSVTPSFAENWLMPRFADFWQKHPDLNLSILPSMDLVDLRRDGIDLAIRYGMGQWAGVAATPLIAADYTVVGAPNLIAGRKIDSLADLSDLPWLFDPMRAEARKWLQESGLSLDAAAVKQVPSFGMVMSALRAGTHLSVVSSTLIEKEIANGTLVALMREQPADLGYYIVHPKGVLPEKTKTVIRWLKSAV
ncbi:MAG: LysR family transcriptional regulator [Pseudomonadota bacterium]